MNVPSISPTLLLVIYCSLVILASLAGGCVLLGMHLTHARLQMAVSVVAGLMLGMALLHFIPHAVHQNHSLNQTLYCVLGGFLVMFFLQRFFPHHHHDVSEGAPEQVNPGNGNLLAQDQVQGHDHPRHTLAEQSAGRLSWAATTAGMAFHSVLGGVALAAAVAAESGKLGATVGLGTALVIILHKPFDAMTVSTLMAASGCSRFSRQVLNVLFALVTPLGALLFYAGVSHFLGADPAFVGSALGFCAGTFLCIACADLLPELQFHSHDRLKLSLALAAGLLIAILIGKLEPSDHEQQARSSAIPLSECKEHMEIALNTNHICQIQSFFPGRTFPSSISSVRSKTSNERWSCVTTSTAAPRSCATFANNSITCRPR
jgi:zinc and cadmium transporter